MPDQGRPIDLAACDHEPIHIPGSIQPHGVLLAVAGGGEVVAASDNAAQLWPQALGRPLGELLGADLAGGCLAAAAGVAHYVGAASIADAEFDVFAHRTNQGAIVELERAAETRPSAIEA